MALKKKTIGAKQVLKPKSNLLSESDLENLSKEYDDLCEHIKALDSKKKEIAEKLKVAAQEQGKEDEKGSFFIQSKTHIIGKVHTQSYTLNHEKGYEFCKKNNLLDCVKQTTTYQVDEQAISQAVADERVDLNTVRTEMYDYRDSYRILVKKRETEEDMPEVQVSNLKR